MNFKNQKKMFMIIVKSLSQITKFSNSGFLGVSKKLLKCMFWDWNGQVPAAVCKNIKSTGIHSLGLFTFFKKLTTFNNHLCIKTSNIL